MTDYPHNLDVRPLTTWPGELTADADRVRSQFSATMRNTLSTLSRELWHLDAPHPVLEVAIEPQQFRLDGKPRAGARAEHPGIVLSLPTTSVGALRYATDRFTTWQDNLRAIALGLEALRKVDRYGITRRGEQYAGFRALPPGKSAIAVEPQMTADEAAQFIAESCDPGTVVSYRDLLPGLGGGGNRRQEYVAAAYRSAARRLHPDAGGSTEAFQKLQDAKRVLDGAR